MQDERYAPPQATVQAAPPASAPADGPAGLGGWLILVAIGLIVSPIRLALLMYTTYQPILAGSAWGRLTSPDSPLYHPLWKPLLAFELVGNTAIIVVGLWALVLFFRRSRRAPRVIIGWHTLAVVVVLVDFVLGEFIPAVANQPPGEAFREMARSVVGAAIWIPYFLTSKRVKNTFRK